MNNLCNDCKWAKWDLDSIDNAYCEQKPVYKVIGEGNYVTECSTYQIKNVIKCIINFIKKR